jgi:hypothetical protein
MPELTKEQWESIKKKLDEEGYKVAPKEEPKWKQGDADRRTSKNDRRKHKKESFWS